MYQLNEFYTAILADWVDRTDLQSSDKHKIVELVKNKIRSFPGYNKKERRGEQQTRKEAENQTPLAKETKAVEDVREEQVELVEQVEEEDDDKIFNEEVEEQNETVLEERPAANGTEQDLLEDVSCSSQDIIERIEGEVRLGVYGVMEKPRKNKLSLLHLTLNDVLIQGSRESLFRKLQVKLEVELYSNEQLEKLLIKKA